MNPSDVKKHLDVARAERDRMVLRLAELQADERAARRHVIAANLIVEQYEHMLRELNNLAMVDQ